jgi:hypothetical protein
MLWPLLKLLELLYMVTSYAGLMGWNGSSGYGESCNTSIHATGTEPWLVRACAGLTGRT